MCVVRVGLVVFNAPVELLVFVECVEFGWGSVGVNVDVGVHVGVNVGVAVRDALGVCFDAGVGVGVVIDVGVGVVGACVWICAYGCACVIVGVCDGIGVGCLELC